jgi:hypothetical protein
VVEGLVVICSMAHLALGSKAQAGMGLAGAQTEEGWLIRPAGALISELQAGLRSTSDDSVITCPKKSEPPTNERSSVLTCIIIVWHGSSFNLLLDM